MLQRKAKYKLKHYKHIKGLYPQYGAKRVGVSNKSPNPILPYSSKLCYAPKGKPYKMLEKNIGHTRASK